MKRANKVKGICQQANISLKVLIGNLLFPKVFKTFSMERFFNAVMPFPVVYVRLLERQEKIELLSCAPR